MKRFVVAVLLGVLATQAVAAALAAKTVVTTTSRGKTKVVQTSPSKKVFITGSGSKRARVVVHRSFPVRRAWPAVIVRPSRVAIIRPAVFIAPILWRPVVVGVPSHKRVVWTGHETLRRGENWVEFNVPCGRRGDSMFMVIDGKAQLEFAEVVFGNGDALVVDFRTVAFSSGHYALVNFTDGRQVDHVRVVGRSLAPTTSLTFKVVT